MPQGPIAPLDATSTPLRSAAVLVPVVDRLDGWTVLLTRRADHLSHHPGQVSLPGGRIDPLDTDATAAALREAHEEIGLEPEGVQVLGYLDDYRTLSSRFVITPVVGLIPEAFTPVVNPLEVAAVFELPLATVLDAEYYQHHQWQTNGVTRWGFVLPHPEFHIWGATAAILRGLALAMALEPRRRVSSAAPLMASSNA